MKERARNLRLLATGLIIAALAAAIAFADPVGPDSAGVVKTGRGTISTTPKSIAAEAGNVTELKLNGTSITKTWQGYYGNISGTIVLDNANNQALYDWKDAAPKGEIFASESNSITWADVMCFPIETENLTNYEQYLGLGANDVDGINETFNAKEHSSFMIGAATIGADSCPSLKTYVAGHKQASSSNFVEVMLFDSVAEKTVYASILNDTVNGFDSNAHDFQMMVPVKGGHDHPATGQDFYFYVELA